jgi:hypothetical protein
MDLTFSSCPPLQPLPRLVYALLRSPLLSSAAQYHSDLTAYLHHLWCCLPPHELAKAVYPGVLCAAAAAAAAASVHVRPLHVWNVLCKAIVLCMPCSLC